MTRESNIGSFLYEWTKWPNEVNKELKVYRYTISDTWSTGQSEKLRQYLHQGTQGYRILRRLKVENGEGIHYWSYEYLEHLCVRAAASKLRQS